MKLSLTLVSILLLTSSAAAPAASPAEQPKRLFVSASINGVPAKALLDSAAEMTFVDDDFARELNLKLEGKAVASGSGGTADVQFAKGVSIASNGVGLDGIAVAVMDLEDINRRLLSQPIDAVIGREFFDAGRVRIDIGKSEILAIRRDREPPGQKIPLKTERGVETFPVSIEGQAPVQAAFDLGNGSEVLIGRDYAERIGLLAPGRVVERKAGGGIGGSIERDIVVLKELSIAGRAFTNVRAAVDPTPTAADLNIGTSILEHFTITADFPQHALWLDPK